MALYLWIALITSFCWKSLFGSENENNVNILKTSPKIVPSGPLPTYRVDDALNLTCISSDDGNLNKSNVLLNWVVPHQAPNSSKVQPHGSNYVNLFIETLQEEDSGEYKCTATYNDSPAHNSETTVKVSVKKKKECGEMMFQCQGMCIHKRYTCDGFEDCKNGADESSKQCGSGNPCDNKLLCPDKRCIPLSWCCESRREPNCTVKVKHTCCEHSLPKPIYYSGRDVDGDPGFQYEQHRLNDMGHLETTVYAVIGCAMAFMLTVTIIVIAICRVHMRRTLLSSCPRAQGNGRSLVTLGRNAAALHVAHPRYYDSNTCFDLNNGLNSNNLMSHHINNPLLVTYNINNGVQFVGRPIDPPPYCEILTSPPLEGPPPPYASKENLCVHKEDRSIIINNNNPNNNNNNDEHEVVVVVVESTKENSEAFLETDVTETDALLGATASNRNCISVISSNRIDVDAHAAADDFTNFICNISKETVTVMPSQDSAGAEECCCSRSVEFSDDNYSDSSHRNKDVSKNSKIDLSTLNNSSLDILILKSDCMESAKQSDNVNNISEKGAIKKIVDSSTNRSLESCSSHLSQKSFLKGEGGNI